MTNHWYPRRSLPPPAIHDLLKLGFHPNYDKIKNIRFVRHRGVISEVQSKTSNDNYAPYIIGLVARERQRQQRRYQRAEQAMDIARQAAVLLREHYPVTRIRVFGSVLEPHRFYEWSDIDLAVEGLPPKDYLRAWALLNGAELKSEFEIDLVVQNECLPYIWAAVEQEGIDL